MSENEADVECEPATLDGVLECLREILSELVTANSTLEAIYRSVR